VSKFGQLLSSLVSGSSGMLGENRFADSNRMMTADNVGSGLQDAPPRVRRICYRKMLSERFARGPVSATASEVINLILDVSN
jgi:hypothetical protein